MRGALLGALLVAVAAGGATRLAPDVRIDLARSTWTLNGQAPASSPAVSSPDDAAPGGGERALVTLPLDARGARWATTFQTDAGRMARLLLDWSGGPDGVLLEVVVDGQRLLPARDAWRPSPRALRTDLGSLWLGPGGHLFEIVAREKPAAPSAVRLAALEVEWLGS